MFTFTFEVLVSMVTVYVPMRQRGLQMMAVVVQLPYVWHCQKAIGG